MTENQLRARVCALAESWVGKKQADGSHREIIDIYNRIRPLPRGYKMTYTDFWCAAAVSALAQALDLTDYIFPECSCDRMIELYKKAGRWMEDDAYRPKPGDVIFYDWQDNGCGDNMGSSDHVGTVISVSGNVINIIEGNCGKAVQWTAREINGRYIRGYGLPDYAAAANSECGMRNSELEEESGSTQIMSPDEDDDRQNAQTDCRPVLPVLRIGDASEAVRAAQLLLKGRGFDLGWMGADGEFGAKTEAAVRRFQTSRWIETDGVIGPASWTELIKFT